MAQTNKPEQSSNDPISHLEKHLLRASDSLARLKAYGRFLPEIVMASPNVAITHASKAIMIALTSSNAEAQVEMLRHRAHAYLNLRNPASALADLHEAQELVMDSGDDTVAARILIMLAEAQRMLGEPVLALACYEKAIAQCGIGITSVRAEVLEAMALFYISVGRYDEAIGFLRESLVIHEERNDPAGRGRALNTIGTAYGKMNELAMAYDYYQRSLDVFQEAGDIGNTVRALANMAGIHGSRGELSDAIAIAWRAYAVCQGNGDWTVLASLTIIIADLHKQQEEPDLALKYYVKAFDLLQKYPDDGLLLGLYQRVGRIHEGMDDLDAARHVYMHALRIAQELQERQPEMELHKAISGVYERQGYYREALGHYQQFATLQQSLAGEEQRQRIAEVQMKYNMMKIKRERDEAQQRVSQLEEDKDLQQQELIQAQINLTEQRANTEKDEARKKHQGKHNRNAGADTKGPANHPGRADGTTAKASGTSLSGTDLEWERLKRQLEKAHPDLERMLFERRPDLTSTEMKICLLTRALGNDTNRIARILGNKVRTLQTQRMKIRKKLELPTEVNFVTFIQTL